MEQGKWVNVNPFEYVTHIWWPIYGNQHPLSSSHSSQIQNGTPYIILSKFIFECWIDISNMIIIHPPIENCSNIHKCVYDWKCTEKYDKIISNLTWEVIWELFINGQQIYASHNKHEYVLIVRWLKANFNNI